jgi:hypothetical protein
VVIRRLHFARGRLVVWLGLLLLAALGLAGAAQAAPRLDYSTKVYLYIRKTRGERTICVGDQVPLEASVLKAYEIVGEGPRLARLYGVELSAGVKDASIGSVSPDQNLTPLGSDPPGAAQFSFLAKKAGTTAVSMRGVINKKQLYGVVLPQVDTVDGEQGITVEQCEYRVNATAVWHLQDISLTALIDNAALVADEGGEGQYHGNADVKWVASTIYPPPCYVVHHPAPSRANITGEKHGALLQVTVQYEATAALFSNQVCPEASTPMFADKLVGPEDLRVWMPAWGGTGTPRHPGLSGAEVLDSVAVVSARVESGQ